MYLGALLAALTCVEHMKKSGSGGIAPRCHFQDVAFRLWFGIRLAPEPVRHVFGKQCLTEKLIYPFNNASSPPRDLRHFRRDRKSTRLNSSHLGISYAVFCL